MIEINKETFSEYERGYYDCLYDFQRNLDNLNIEFTRKCKGLE